MCGLAGVVRLDGGPVEPELLERMGAALAHRGPDGAGQLIRGPVGLVHRRLAIIDPAGGAQPLVDEERGTALVYNGEVYNFLELRAELGAGRFASACDSEVVLRAHGAWGPEGVTRLRGMFAYALHDAPARRLYLVRDRLGIKPLYWARSGQRLVFASEAPALLASGLITPRVCPEALASYLRYQYVPTPATIHEGVHRLPPATVLEVDLDGGGVRLRRYWDCPGRVVARAEEEALGALEEALEEAVALHLRSDVPFGAFLSGGVDSSLVTGLMARRLQAPVRTFAVGVPGDPASELGHARRVSEALGTIHEEVSVTGEEAAALLPELATRLGEPFGDSSAVPTYFVSRAAARHVKMVLSGDGGDELFAGYDSYALVQRRLGRLGPARALAWRVAATFLRDPTRREAARLRGLGPVAAHHALRQVFHPGEVRRLVGREPASPAPLPLPGSPLVTRLQAHDLATYLEGDILVKVDRAAMASSLEVRVPLLDHRVVELALSLPVALKLRPRGIRRVTTKHLLKRAAGRFIPRDLLERRKQGFGVPVAGWLAGPLRPLVRAALLDPRAPIHDHLARDAVEALARRALAGDAAVASRVWSLLMLSLWLAGAGAGGPTR